MARSEPDHQTRRLFRDTSGQDDLFERSYEEELEARRGQPVACLGMTFENNEKRREYFLEKLRQKLRDPEFRKIEGFPIGEDEDILALSDPPYYTACPNPFLTEFVKYYGHPYNPEQPYHREPFAVDVSEGKTDPLYKAHGYHTKVPHRAIVPSILHYTKPGDIVLDGFCGSGMTGVAAQWCGTAPAAYREELERRWKAEGRELPEWGARRVILGDLSPAAAFIAANYNLPFDVAKFSEVAGRLLGEVEAEVGWMYETLHTDGKTKGRINYTVWSEVFSCPECAGEVVFLDEALDQQTKKTRSEFPCPHCSAELTKDNLERFFEALADPASGEPWKRIRFRPALINYSVGKERYEKEPSSTDHSILARIANLRLPSEVPTNAFPLMRCTTGRGSPRRASRTCTTCSCRALLMRCRQCGTAPMGALTAVYATCCCSSSSRRSGACRYSIAMALLTSPKSTASCQVSTTLVHKLPRCHRGTSLMVSCAAYARHSSRSPLRPTLQ